MIKSRADNIHTHDRAGLDCYWQHASHRCLYSVYGVSLHRGVGFAIYGYGGVDASFNPGILYIGTRSVLKIKKSSHTYQLLPEHKPENSCSYLQHNHHNQNNTKLECASGEKGTKTSDIMGWGGGGGGGGGGRGGVTGHLDALTIASRPLNRPMAAMMPTTQIRVVTTPAAMMTAAPLA